MVWPAAATLEPIVIEASLPGLKPRTVDVVLGGVAARPTELALV